jgi:hypothetical protein
MRSKEEEHLAMYVIKVYLMRVASMKIVKKNIWVLKDQKKKCFLANDRMVDFKVVLETCREMDILLLPLYFVWEHIYKQKLSDVQFEPHLWKPYSNFSLMPRTTTWIILLLLFPEISSHFSIDTKKELLCIYKSIVKSPIE